MVVWFTGIPSAGKTTLSKRVHAELRAAGYNVELLDGDLLRRQLSKDLGFTKADRDENIRRIGSRNQEEDWNTVLGACCGTPT